MTKQNREQIEKKLDRILLNQTKIMKNLALGFPELRKGEILNNSLFVAIEETEKIFEEKPNDKRK